MNNELYNRLSVRIPFSYKGYEFEPFDKPGREKYWFVFSCYTGVIKVMHRADAYKLFKDWRGYR